MVYPLKNKIYIFTWSCWWLDNDIICNWCIYCNVIPNNMTLTHRSSLITENQSNCVSKKKKIIILVSNNKDHLVLIQNRNTFLSIHSFLIGTWTQNSSRYLAPNGSLVYLLFVNSLAPTEVISSAITSRL